MPTVNDACTMSFVTYVLLVICGVGFPAGHLIFAGARAQAAQSTDSGAINDRSVLVTGQITNQSGGGHARVKITIHQRQEGTALGPLIAETTTDELGDFVVTAERPFDGEVQVSISKEHFSPIFHHLRLDKDKPPPFLGETLVGNLTLAGRVVDALTDKPVPQAAMTLRSLIQEWHATSDDQGRFTISGVTPDEGELVVQAEGYGRERQAVKALETATDIEVRLNPERIVHFLVEDDRGGPIDGVTIEAYDRAHDDFRTVVTDVKGAAELKGLPYETSDISLRLHHEDYVSSEGFDYRIHPPAGERESTHYFKMVRAGRVHGTVSDAEGRPLGGARITTGNIDSPSSPRSWTDYQGTYAVKGVPPGAATITVHSSGFAPELATVEVKGGESSSLNMTLRPGMSLEGFVRAQDGAPLPGVEVQTGLWRGFQTLGLRAMTDREGRFVMADVPHDEFEIRVTSMYGLPVTEKVRVGNDKNGKPVVMVLPITPLPVSAWPGGGLKVGDTLPALTLTTLNGQQLDFAALKGKTVLVEFWATWCLPCVAELPDLVALQERYATRNDFVMIGVSLDDDEKVLRAFLAKRKLPWHQVFGETGGASRAVEVFGARLVPAIFIIGPDGKVAATWLRGRGIAERLEKLLPQSASP